MSSPPIIQIVFAAFYMAFFSAILRKADVWFPFSPTKTDVPNRWTGLHDFVRYILAGVFLIALPATYFLCVLIWITQSGIQIHLRIDEATAVDFIKVAAVIGLIVPPLGFYDVWQAIVRSSKWFYGSRAITAIEGLYPNAFKPGVISTVSLGAFWIGAPIAFALLVFWEL